MLYPGWWHFGGHFSIADLDGLGHCTALTDLNLNSMVAPCSLAPLATLTSLRRLVVDAIDDHRDLETLTNLPALTELEIVNFARTNDHERWPGIIGELRAHGVSVHGW
ncbi:hypothetical protein Dvina_18795 [Dactylosporangium vinaceum]|nr:hypothetical protein [Dactylosporangium vinaceum]UAB99922.1 hypothetical protein Dvina_18795 [Dactylosporangium vinaceum]